jgi:hypothetical protein
MQGRLDPPDAGFALKAAPAEYRRGGPPAAGLSGRADLGRSGTGGRRVAGQIAQRPDQWRWHETGPDRAVLDHLRDPRQVGHVGLAAGHVVQVLGVD